MNQTEDVILRQVKQLLLAFENNLLGNQKMPEVSHPQFYNTEETLLYFTGSCID